MKCPRCWTQNPKGAKACKECGLNFKALGGLENSEIVLDESVSQMGAPIESEILSADTNLGNILKGIRKDTRSMRKSMLLIQSNLNGIFWIMWIFLILTIGLSVFSIILILSSGLL